MQHYQCSFQHDTLFVELIWGRCGCIHVYGYWMNPKCKHLSIEHLWNINTHHRTRQNVHQKTMIRILTMFTVKYCYPASPLLLPTMPKDNISFFAGCLTVLICHSIALAACCSALGSLSTMGLSERSCCKWLPAGVEETPLFFSFAHRADWNMWLAVKATR